MTDITIPATTAVPQDIVLTLRRLIRRLRLTVALRGLLAFGAVAVAAVLAIMGIEALVFLEAPWRWGLSGLGLAVTLFSLWFFLVRPLARSMSLTGVARMIEIRHPEMQERISSALELLSSADSPDLRGSAQLIAALARQASDQATAIAPRREISFKSARRVLLAFALAGAILAGLMLGWPNATWRQLAQAIVPSAELGNFYADDLVVTPGNKTIPQGRQLEVQVLVKGRAVSKATLRLQSDSTQRSIQMAALRQDDQQRFVATCDAPAQVFRYRVQAGKAISPYYTITVVPLPAARQVVLALTYPDYTSIKPHTFAAPAEIRAIAGTKATLTVEASKPLKAAELVIQAQSTQTIRGRTSDSGNSFQFDFTLTPQLKGTWHIRLVDENGFESLLDRRPIEALADTAPTATIVSPAAALKLKRSDHLPIVYELKDDFGISKAQLLLKTDAGALQPQDLPAAITAEPAKHVLDLGNLKLADARTLTCQVRVLDNLPADLRGPQEGLSREVNIELTSDAPSYAAQIQMAEELQIRKVLEKVLAQLKDAKAQSGPLQAAMPKLESLTPVTVERIDTMRTSLHQADADLRQLIDALAGGDYAEMSKKLTTLANDHVNKAYNLGGSLKLQDDAKKRGEIADETDFQVDRSIAIVSELLGQLAVMTDLLQRAEALNDMAQQQEDLAAQKAGMEQTTTQPAPDGQQLSAADLAKANDAWQKQQEELSKQLDKQMLKTPGALGQRAKAEEQSARDLAAEAKNLARQQAALSQESRQSQQLKQLQEDLAKLAQQQAELAKQAATKDNAKADAPKMDEAAKNIGANKLKDAVAKQDEVEQDLRTAQQQAQQAKAAADLAQQAKELAQQQEAAAKDTQSSMKQSDQAKNDAQAAAQKAKDAKAAADQAQKQAADAQAQAQAAKNAGAPDADQKQQAADAAAQAAQKAKDNEKAAGDQADQASKNAADAEAKVVAAAGKQQDLGKKAAGLVQQAARGAPPMAQAARDADPTDKMNRAAKAVQSRDKAAGQAADEATAQAQKFAKAMQDALTGPKTPQEAQQKADDLQQIAAKQADIHTQTARLANQQQQLTAAQKNLQLSRLKAEQAQVAQEAAKLSDRVKAAEPQDDRLDSSAARSAQEASEQLNNEKESQAAQSADKAGKELGELSKRLGAEAAKPEDQQKPDNDVAVSGSQKQEPDADKSLDKSQKKEKLAEDASALAARQQQLAREMKALAKGDAQEVTAARQQTLGEQTTDVAKQASLLREHAKELMPDQRMHQTADRANQELAKAQGDQRQAQGALDRKDPGSAMAPQESGAAALNRAAQELEQLGRQMNQSAKGDQLPADQQAAQDAQDMAEASAEADEAAEQNSASDAEQAAKLLGQLAKSANAKAMAAGVVPGNMPGLPSQQNDGQAKGLSMDAKKGNLEMMDAGLTDQQLREMGLSPSDWARLPSELKDQVLQAAQDASPAEYRGLIKRYFQTIAKGRPAVAATTQPAQGGGK